MVFSTVNILLGLTVQCHLNALENAAALAVVGDCRLRALNYEAQAHEAHALVEQVSHVRILVASADVKQRPHWHAEQVAVDCNEAVGGVGIEHRLVVGVDVVRLESGAASLQCQLSPYVAVVVRQTQPYDARLCVAIARLRRRDDNMPLLTQAVVGKNIERAYRVREGPSASTSWCRVFPRETNV